MSLPILLARCLMLRCPACGKGKLAKDWRDTNLHCQQCGHDFRVETGFYLGSIYFNYGITALLGIAIGLPLYLSGWLSPLVLASATVVFCVLFSLWFFRYARSLWLAFDYYYCHESRGLGHQSQPVAANDHIVLKPSDAEPNQKLHDFLCPCCHRSYWFRDQALRSWSECPYCQRQVLLLPSPAFPGAKTGENVAKPEG